MTSTSNPSFNSNSAKIISYIFHPLLMPTYGMFLYFRIDHSASYFVKFDLKVLLIIMTFVFTFILPLINSLFLLRSKFIKSLSMETKEERRLPLLMTAIFFSAEYWMLHDRAIPELLKFFLLNASLTIVFTLIINIFWKISAHMVGIGGMCGAMFVLSYLIHYDNAAWLMIILLLAGGIIGAARLQMKAHTPLEVFGGFILGLGCPMMMFLLPS